MRRVPGAPTIVLRNEQLERVLYGVLCGAYFYCADNEKALINVDNRQEYELCVKLRILVVEMCLGHFRIFFFLIHVCHFNRFMCLFINRLSLMRHGVDSRVVIDRVKT